MFRIKETFSDGESVQHVQYLTGFGDDVTVEYTYSEDPERAYLFVAQEHARQVVDGIETENWRNRDSGAVYEIEAV